MTRRASVGIAVTACAMMLVAPSARAQGAPAQRPAVIPPPAPATALAAPTPPDSAVALCNDGSWIKLPRTAAECAARGGLKVAMPPRLAPPPAPVAASEANRNIIVTQTATLNAGIPANATVQCKDGTFLFGAPSESRCAQNGGVAAILPVAPAPRRP